MPYNDFKPGKGAPADPIVETEADEPLLEHEYDGIREADNPLPRWWVNLFWITIVFGIVYVPVVHTMDILPRGNLTRANDQAKLLAEQREAELVASGAYDKDPVAAGKKYFGIFCVTCHGTHGEGGIGPNLTDSYWIHGPQEADIVKTISTGVAAKGMPTWGPILGDRKVKMIAAYVLTLWETKPPVPGKKAEGVDYNMADIRKPAVTDSVASKPDSTAPKTETAKAKV
jgi:cytochrome c oxidase cbb3-type subunit 3